MHVGTYACQKSDIRSKVMQHIFGKVGCIQSYVERSSTTGGNKVADLYMQWKSYSSAVHLVVAEKLVLLVKRAKLYASEAKRMFDAEKTEDRKMKDLYIRVFDCFGKKF